MTRESLRISMLSSFYIAFVLHGLQRMSGLFIIEFLKIKNITQQAAAIPFIYSWAVAKIVASFSDFLIDNKFSELVILCGALLCAMGAALCILDADITAITVFWGFIFGSGYGLTSPYLTKSSANRHSSNVSLIMEVPLCLGISILPFLLNTLISQYGLQGSFILFSGIVLQYVPLALAAAYNIQIRIPKIKWRVRRKCSQSTSKHEGEKTISIKNFTNSLEPDFVLKIEQSDDYHKIKKNDPEILPKEIVGRRRSNTRSSDLQDLQMNTNILHKHITHPQTVLNVENFEKNLKNSETNVSNTDDVIDIEIECKGFRNLSVINSEILHDIPIEDKNLLNVSKHSFHFKSKKLKSISLNEIKETDDEKEESEKVCPGNDILKDQKNLADTGLENIELIVTDDRKDINKRQISETSEIEKSITVTSQHAKTPPQKFHCVKDLNKETPILSTQALQSTVIFTIPLDIKVHVEEYTFTVDEKYISNNFDSNYSDNMTSKEKSRYPAENKYFNCASKNVSKDILRNLDNKSNTSNIQYVSQNHKLRKEIPLEMNKKPMDSNINRNESKLKFIHFLNFLNKIISPVSLGIIIIAIIFETTIITLLTNIGDIENFSDRTFNDFKWILVAFGMGGLFEKFCYFKISQTISKKSHTVGVVLFLLTALSIAGVLYSPNLKWSAGFYSILGALEGGISSILSKFVLDYTHKDVHHMISSMKNFLSGATIICLPYVLGLLSEEMGNYEFLLETFSYLSVLCAFIVYFLPHLSSISDKSSPFSYKGNINS